MAIVVENGTIINGANSYVSEAELTAFSTTRNISLSGNYTAEQLLILSMDYIESLQYKGLKRRYDQALQWPRTDVYIDGYYHNADQIPNELKNGQMQTALAIDAGNGPQQNIPRKTIREKVGDLEVQYATDSSSIVIDTKISYFLRKLLDGGYGGNQIKASKA